MGSSMTTSKIDITPTPQVLIALTNTPLKPLDALCELIDNGIDAFRSSKLEGKGVENPWIQITVPGPTEVSRGLGVIRIADNGAGLDESALQKALTAGYSSQNQFDSLGLFGMGFNIASGKLGMKTVVTTTRKGDDFATQTVLDLPSLVSGGTFSLDTTKVEKPADLDSGTIVEISGWWPEGSQNAGFVKQLAQVSKPKLANQIGRRYSSILRNSENDRISIRLNDEPIRGFEHCVWDESRFVERQGWGRIPAKISFNEVLNTQRHCKFDRTRISEGAETCAQCGGRDFRTVEERIRGWVGVQRYDDADYFGVDVIRNGRTILVGEKDAFFSLNDDIGSKSKEYPVDGVYGRIVGEVNLDHVPVDFTKQDFQRASDAWMRAIDFLRGKSLHESKWDEGYRNETPIGRLFKGYRKVRRVGREDMYMGRWDESKNASVRVSRDQEREYLERFEKRELGYYDDANWWKLVEDATTPPLKGLIPCPNCKFQNSETDEECADCGKILKAKECVSCASEIKASAISCPNCGVSQVPEVDEPWLCEICAQRNHIDDEQCSNCQSLRGTPDPMSPASLSSRANRNAELSFDARTFVLGSGVMSQPVTLNAFEVSAGSLTQGYGKGTLATFTVKQTIGVIDLYFDPAHDAFTRMGVMPEVLISGEVADYLHHLNGGVRGVSIIATSMVILREVWGDSIGKDVATLAVEVSDLFAQVCENLINHPQVSDFYDELSELELTSMTASLIKHDLLNELESFKRSGQYLAYLEPHVISRFFARFGDSWFGIVWSDELPKVTSVGADAIAEARNQKVRSYQRALDECADFTRVSSFDQLQIDRVGAALEYLQSKLV
jgi:hypothetical protein